MRTRPPPAGCFLDHRHVSLRRLSVADQLVDVQQEGAEGREERAASGRDEQKANHQAPVPRRRGSSGRRPSGPAFFSSYQRRSDGVRGRRGLRRPLPVVGSRVLAASVAVGAAGRGRSPRGSRSATDSESTPAAFPRAKRKKPVSGSLSLPAGGPGGRGKPTLDGSRGGGGRCTGRTDTVARAVPVQHAAPRQGPRREPQTADPRRVLTVNQAAANNLTESRLSLKAARRQPPSRAPP